MEYLWVTILLVVAFFFRKKAPWLTIMLATGATFLLLHALLASDVQQSQAASVQQISTKRWWDWTIVKNEKDPPERHLDATSVVAHTFVKGAQLNGWKRTPTELPVIYPMQAAESVRMPTGMNVALAYGGNLVIEWPGCPDWEVVMDAYSSDSKMSPDISISKFESRIIQDGDANISVKGRVKFKPRAIEFANLKLRLQPPQRADAVWVGTVYEKALPRQVLPWAELPTTCPWELYIGFQDLLTGELIPMGDHGAFVQWVAGVGPESSRTYINQAEWKTTSQDAPAGANYVVVGTPHCQNGCRVTVNLRVKLP